MATPTVRQEVAGTSTTVTSLTNTATFSSAALAGNQLVYVIAGDKNTGTLSVTDNTGSGTWTVEVSLPSTSVSLYIARKVAVGGETTITGTTTAAPATGNTGYALELDQAGTGAWGVVAKATNITTEATVSSMSTGTTAAATFEGLAIAAMAVDSATNVTSGSWSNGYTARYDAPTTSGTGGGAGGIHVASAAVAQGATTTSTWTNTTGTADQQSAAVVVFGRAAVASVTGTGASALALTTSPAGSKAPASAAGSALGLGTAPAATTSRAAASDDALTLTTSRTATSVHSGTGLSALGVTTTATGAKENASLPASGPLFFNFWVVNPATGAYVAPLPEYRSATIEPVFGEPGQITIDYPVDGLNYNLLRDGVTETRDLEIAVWVGGRRDAAMRAILMEASGDEVSEDGIRSFTGAFLNVLLTEMVILPNPGVDKQETVFVGKTAGEMVKALVATAQAAGYLTGISTASFSNTVDSNGSPWGQTANFRFSPGRTYADALGDLAEYGLSEWEITADRQLRLYRFGTLGADRTIGAAPIILREGRHLTSAPRKTSVRAAGTDLLAAGKEGLYQTAFSADARSLRGRRILRYTSANGIEDAGALTAYTQAQLQVAVAGQLEQSHGLAFGQDDPLPIADYGLGDWVGSDTGRVPSQAFEKLRVKQWRFAEDADGEITGSVVVGTLFLEGVDRLARRIAAIENGTVVVGTSTPTDSVPEDTTTPKAPEGVTASSIAYGGEFGDPLAAVIVGWGQVFENVDGSDYTDAGGYKVQMQSAAETDSWLLVADVAAAATSAEFGGVAQNTTIRVRVAAYDYNGHQSGWSASVTLVTESDTTPPPVPSTPVVSDYLGTLKIAWDGLTAAGADMLDGTRDFDYVEVHVSPASNFTPADTTLVGRMSARGAWVVTDLPYGVGQFARLVAVDRRPGEPNKSDPSAQGTATPNKVVADDVFDGAIGTAKLADAAITTAKINDLAVNDAKIGTLSVGKLTAGTFSASMTLSGIIRTATSGARAEIDGAGIRLYNAGGGLTARLQATDGSALLTGTIQSALTGARLVVNPGGTAADRINFYDDAGTTRAAYLYTYTVSGQANLIGRGSSTRTDQKSGEFGAWPLEGYVRWVAPGSVNPNSSATARETEVLVEGPSIKFQRRDQFPNDGGAKRVEWLVRNTSNTIVNASVLYLQSASGNEPWLQAPTSNSGIGFAGGNVTALFNNGAMAAFSAAAFNVNSSVAVKTAVQPLALPDTEGARGALRRAPSAMWKYRADLETERDWPDKPGGWADEHELEWHCKPFEAPWHVGPMAEDLPEWMVQHLDDGRAVVNVDNKVGFLWRVCEEQDRELRDLRARVDALTGPVIVDGEAC